MSSPSYVPKKCVKGSAERKYKRWRRDQRDEKIEARSPRLYRVRARECRKMKQTVQSALSYLELSDADRIALLEAGDASLLNGELHD